MSKLSPEQHEQLIKLAESTFDTLSANGLTVILLIGDVENTTQMVNGSRLSLTETLVNAMNADREVLRPIVHSASSFIKELDPKE